LRVLRETRDQLVSREIRETLVLQVLLALPPIQVPRVPRVPRVIRAPRAPRGVLGRLGRLARGSCSLSPLLHPHLPIPATGGTTSRPAYSPFGRMTARARSGSL